MDRSPLRGVGLFTDEDLAKGQLVYIASPIFDVNITAAQFDNLVDKEKREVKYYGFWIKADQVWHVDFDDSRFINHDYDAALTQDVSHKDAYLITTRNVKKGEELTQNYLEFETKEDLKKRGIK